MKKILLFFIFLIISITVNADSTDITRQRLTPHEFIIMPWAHYWWTNNTEKEEYYKDMYNCGFNITHFIPPTDVKLAEKYNLKASVFVDMTDDSNADYKTKANKFTDRVIKEVGKKNMHNVYMVMLQDEPTANEETLARLSAYSDAIKNNCNAQPYINLLPQYASQAQFGMESYEDYLDYYTKGCKLDYISYDNYPFCVGVNPERNNLTYSNRDYYFDEDSWFSNLEAVKTVAEKNKVRFIPVIQSVGALNWPDPDDYIIHVQGWSALAYGAGGISYFTYNTPNLGNYRSGAYDEYHMKSPTWKYIAHMNYAIHNIGAVYKNLNHINVYHIGNIPSGCKDQSSAVNVKNLYLNPVTNLVLKKPIEGKANVVVGEFLDKEKRPYAMIVNKDPIYSVAIRIEFNKGDKIYKVEDRSVGIQVKEFRGEDTCIAPGHGVLLFAE